jgi:hypothetical protein
LNISERNNERLLGGEVMRGIDGVLRLCFGRFEELLKALNSF